MRDWVADHALLLGILSVVGFLGTLAVIPVLVAKMPADYFLQESPPPGSARGRHPIVSLLVRAGKCLIGVLLVVAGVLMLLGPGQGILTILLGVMLLEFPGKRRLELRLIRWTAVHRAIDWIRKRAGRPPLELPENTRTNPHES